MFYRNISIYIEREKLKKTESGQDIYIYIYIYITKQACRDRSVIFLLTIYIYPRLIFDGLKKINGLG